MKKNKFKLSASLISSDLAEIKKTIQNLEKGKIDFIHYDVMDGIFVPRFGLHPEMLKIVKSMTKIPINVHMMIENVEPYLDVFINNGADYITFHSESTKHIHRIIHLIHEKNAKAGIALNPATSLSILDYILDDIDLVMIMAINPGIVGHKLIDKTYNKIKDLKEKIYDNKNIIIEVDGGVSEESAALMINAGADILVCGSQSIFKKGGTLPIRINKFRKHINRNI